MQAAHRAFRPLVLSLVLALLAACASKDPVTQLLADLEDALEDQDGDAVAELLTDDFQGTDGTDKATVVGTLRRYLAAYQSLDVDLSKVETNRRADSARVKFNAKASGIPRELGGLGDMIPRSISYDIDLTLRNESGTWRISQATWSDVAAAAAPTTPSE